MAKAMTPQEKMSPRALICVPTRELAQQVLWMLSKFASTNPTVSFSAGFLVPPPGIPFSQCQGKDIAVTTVRSLADFVQLKKPKHGQLLSQVLSRTEMIVLDECDAIIEDELGLKLMSNKVLKSSLDSSEEKPRKQIVFVAATLPPVRHERSLTPRAHIMRHYKDITEVSTLNLHKAPEQLQESFVEVTREESLSVEEEIERKTQLVEAMVLEASTVKTSATWLVFVNKNAHINAVCDRLKQIQLKDFKVNVEKIVGDSPKLERAETIAKYSRPALDAESLTNTTSETPELNVIVSTDICARGIDFKDVAKVIHFDFPPTPAIYLHRIGRTARLGRQGESVALVTPSDRKLATILAMASQGQRHKRLQGGAGTLDGGSKIALTGILRPGGQLRKSLKRSSD